MCMVGGIGPGPCIAQNVQDIQSACGGGFVGGCAIDAFAFCGKALGGARFAKLKP